MTLKYSDNLYLLSVIDIVDRYDIILLEVRHLQKIIIDALHAPTLFLPLRREEKYIFGGWLDEKNGEYQNIISHEKDFAKVASLCITRYPSPDTAVRFITETSREELLKQDIDMMGKLKRYIGHLWAGDLWVGSERIHYHALRALQVLKQQIIRDKLIFLSEAHDAGIVKVPGAKKNRCKMSLMILRRGVLNRMNGYIRVFRTHQQQFGKSLDFGLQSYPRPGIERRRDIGIYNDFLANRTHDLHKDMQHFIKSFLDPADVAKKESLGWPIVLHGWSQSPSVSGSQLYDDVGRSLRENGEKNEDGSAFMPQHVSYVDTSFWSPDRPDLQPLVAKYVAESLARNYLGKINEQYLSNHTDDFANLLAELNAVVTSFVRNTPEFTAQKDAYRNLVNKHLSIDFLASTVKGIAYLYAEFLSIVGEGLEDQLRTTDGFIKLEMLADLEDGIKNYEDTFVWYFRLRLTSFWLEKVIHSHCSTLDKVVLKGSRQVCDDLLDFLDENLATTHGKASDKQQVMGVLWKALAEKMEYCIGRHVFVRKAKQWRKKRSDDTWCEKELKPGEKRFHRSTIRFDVRLQNFMFEGTLKQKSQASHKPIIDESELDQSSSDTDSSLSIKEKLYADFYDVYGLKVQKNTDPLNTENKYRHPRWLYRHLHQIPFQCAILRSIDLLGYHPQEETIASALPWRRKVEAKPRTPEGRKRRPYKWPEFIDEIHTDMSLGREKFALGLEFYTWSRESPRDRLGLCNNLIVFILPQLSDALEVKKHLEDWLRGEENLEINTPKAVRDIATDLTNSRLKDFYYKDDHLFKTGAESINRAFSLIKSGSCKKTRRLEQLAGYKLKELLAIYEEYIAKPYVNEDAGYVKLNILLALGAYLKIRANTEKKAFYKLVLQGFNNASKESDLPERIPPVMLSRAVLTNYHSVADPYAVLDKSVNKQFLEQKMPNYYGYNVETLHHGITLGNWTCPNIPPDKTDNEMSDADCNHHQHIETTEEVGRFHTILGRYDMVGFVPARMPCKCKIPSFDCAMDESETFINHFTRREIALPVNVQPVNPSEKTMFGIISVSLQRRAMRLSLLYRIMSAINHDEASGPQPKMEQSIQNIATKYSDTIHIQGYITDGWGDFLLVFQTINGANVKGEELVNDIFVLQQMLYEDFMVDRTELIYTPRCIDYIARAEGYDFSITVRMMEDRKLEASVEDFINAFEQNASDLNKRVPEIIDSKICQTPGRTDLTMNFTIKKGSRPEGLYNNILLWMSEMKMAKSTWYSDSMSMLGKVETIIERSNIEQNIETNNT